VEYVLVFILAFLAGGWAVSSGILFDLNPVGVWIAASLGSMAFLGVALTAGGKLRDLLVRRLGGESGEQKIREKVGPMVDRWGTAGFGLIGPLVVGPSLSILGALVVGLDRRRFAIMFTIGTVVGFGVLALVVDLLRGSPAMP
jgi:hypothetical protein